MFGLFGLSQSNGYFELHSFGNTQFQSWMSFMVWLMSVLQITLILLLSIVSAGTVLAQAEMEPRQAPNADVLTQERWQQVDAAVKRGLEWLASQQGEDGSYETIERAQPAVTSLCLMAFLAQGESLVDGKDQQALAKAIEFISDQQKPNGLIATVAPQAVPIPRDPASSNGLATSPDPNMISVTAVYNHAISALALCEAYGQCAPEQSEKLAPVIEKAIAATLEMQRWGGKKKSDVGGWRYLAVHFAEDSDLSVTGWQLMFLRSARDAGFDVPKESIDAGVKYVENCVVKNKNRRAHSYLATRSKTVTRAMAGTGILAMAHAGKHNSPAALASGEWILKHDFKTYDGDKHAYGVEWLGDRYHYGAALCAQGMYQLGGKYWNRFFPPLVDALLANQQESGAWLTQGKDQGYGSCYTTAMTVLALSAPNQMLPIFQR